VTPSENDERRRRKCFNDAAGKMTKSARRIDTKYWVQDKEKDRKRKLMSAKLFKGKKKPKFGRLSGDQEQKLLGIIDSKLDESQSEEEEAANKERWQCYETFFP
jgi:hypothetical protein